MEAVTFMVMSFTAMCCVVKLSFWRVWQRIVYSSLLAAFTLWSERYAVMQSKTQLTDYLQNTAALENMAILVTVESAIGFAFAACWMRGSYAAGKAGWAQSALLFYPPLLMFPLSFYALTQVIFALPGVSFMRTAVIVAAVMWAAPPLLAGLVRRLLPDADFRMEALLLLTCFLCALGLVSTQNGKLIYAAQTQRHASPLPLAAGVALALSLFLAGMAWDRAYWRYFKNKT